MDNQACCAHSKVRLIRTHHQDGTLSDNWICDLGCGTQFVPVPKNAERTGDKGRLKNHSHCYCSGDGRCCECEPYKIDKYGNLIEILASIEHERWSDWQKWVHKKLEKYADDTFYRLDEEDFDRWERQINTQYSKLSEGEKQSDRDQVMRYWPIIKSLLHKQREELLEKAKISKEYFRSELDAVYDIAHEEEFGRDWQIKEIDRVHSVHIDSLLELIKKQ